MIPLLLALAAAVQQTAPGATLLDRNRLDRQPVSAQPPVAAPAKAPVSVAIGDPNVTIRGIRFLGARAPDTVAHAAEAFLGRRATRETLSRLAAALSSGYGKSAVALYTVAIPNQDFRDGVVQVSLTEGRIAHTRIVRRPGDKRGHTLLARRMQPLTQEVPLERATFERQFTLMRAIPGLTFDTGLTDPHHDGALDLDVTPRQRRVKITGGFSNRGVQTLGVGQLDLRGDLFGAAVDGDDLSIAASGSTDLRRYRSATASYAAPIGASGLSASGSFVYLETRPENSTVTGTAGQAGVGLSYPLIRSFTKSADVSIAFDGLNSDAAAFGLVIAREHSRAFRAAASYAAASARRSVSVSGSVSRGLDVLGASANADYTNLGFAKGVAGISAAQAIGKRTVLRLTASGQYTADKLPAAERFALGGPAIGRAFDIAILTGDRGGGGSAEFAWRPIKRASLSGSELYGFVDAGSVRVLARGPFAAQDYSLASVGFGGRARFKTRAELGLEVAHPLQRPYAVPVRGADDDWRLLVSWRIASI